MFDLQACLRGDSQHWPLLHDDLDLGGDAANLVLSEALVDALLAGVDVLEDEAPA